MHQKYLETEINCLGNGHASVADTLMNMGNVYDSLGDHETALVHYQKALNIYVQALGPSRVSVAETMLSVAETMFNMSIVYDNTGGASKGLELTRSAHSICLAALGRDHPKTKECAQFI
jgi:tetratricopeptide (TPR) repeat protein